MSRGSILSLLLDKGTHERHDEVETRLLGRRRARRMEEAPRAHHRRLSSLRVVEEFLRTKSHLEALLPPTALTIASAN